jgi:hypothetical protein
MKKEENNYFCEEDNKSIHRMRLREHLNIVTSSDHPIQWIRFMLSMSKYKLLNEVFSFNIKLYWQKLIWI